MPHHCAERGSGDILYSTELRWSFTERKNFHPTSIHRSLLDGSHTHISSHAYGKLVYQNLTYSREPGVWLQNESFVQITAADVRFLINAYIKEMRQRALLLSAAEGAVRTKHFKDITAVTWYQKLLYTQELTWTWLLPRTLQWIFWLKRRCYNISILRLVPLQSLHEQSADVLCFPTVRRITPQNL